MGNGLNYPGHNFIKASNHPRKSSTIILSFNPSLQKVYYPNQEKFVPIDSLLLKDDFPKIVLLPLCSLSMSKRKKKKKKTTSDVTSSGGLVGLKKKMLKVQRQETNKAGREDK